MGLVANDEYWLRRSSEEPLCLGDTDGAEAPRSPREDGEVVCFCLVVSFKS